MKTSLLLAVTIFMSVIALTAHSQQTIITKLTYDTTVNGTGSMNPPYDFNFPKFNTSLGTLSEVRVASVLTWNYGFTIESKETSTKTAKVKIFRSDDIVSPVLMTPDNSLNYSFSSAFININLGATDNISGSGPDFVSRAPVSYGNHDTVINQTLYNTGSFMGTGSINFQYGTDVGYSASGANVDFRGDALDQIKMSITYVYSNPVILASSITSFTANKRDKAIDLNWHTTNESGDRTYEVLKSTDGKVFTVVTKLNAAPDGSQAGNYQYNYVPGKDETGKLFFQIKQIESRGTAKYSAQRSVELGIIAAKPGMRLYPNPAKSGDVTVVFSDTKPGSYDIQLFNIKGQVVRQMQVSNALQFKISLNNQLQAGDYFVMAVNKKTGHKDVERLVIH